MGPGDAPPLNLDNVPERVNWIAVQAEQASLEAFQAPPLRSSRPTCSRAAGWCCVPEDPDHLSGQVRTQDEGSPRVLEQSGREPKADD